MFNHKSSKATLVGNLNKKFEATTTKDEVGLVVNIDRVDQ
jgi:hypothetical protein